MEALASQRRLLTRLMLLSVAAGLVTIALKMLAWRLTGSTGLLSDALESIVNLAAALIALIIVRWATLPADQQHMYGHEKAEYFSAGVEGGLIVVAAASIAWVAIRRLLHPVPLEHVSVGLAVSAAASLINLLVGLTLVHAGRRHRSITVEADGRHLLTDVWTSVGVIAAVAVVALTGWERLDPLIALAVAANIVFTGVKLVRRSSGGLMDRALSAGDQDALNAALAPTAAGASPSTQSATARPDAAPSSPCTYSSPAAGRSSRDTTCSNASKPTSAPPCRTAPSSRTSNRSKTPPPSTTPHSTAATNKRRRQRPTDDTPETALGQGRLSDQRPHRPFSTVPAALMRPTISACAGRRHRSVRHVALPRQCCLQPLLRRLTTEACISPVDPTGEHERLTLVGAGLDVTAVHANARRAEEPQILRFRLRRHLRKSELPYDPGCGRRLLDHLPGFLEVRATREEEDFHRRGSGHKPRLAQAILLHTGRASRGSRSATEKRPGMPDGSCG